MATAEAAEITEEQADEIIEKIKAELEPLSEAEERVQITRIKMTRARLYRLDSADEAFLAHLCIFPDVYRYEIGTAATNGKCIMWNLKFVKSLSDKELYGVLIHELLHIGLLHMPIFERLEDKQRGNIAADLAINCIIENIATADLPEGGCFVGKGPFADFPEHQTFEHYYRLLEDKSDEDLEGYVRPDLMPLGAELDEDGNPIPGSGGTKLEQNAAIERIKAAARAAAEKASASRGNMSSALSKQIEAATAAKVDYRRILRSFRTKLTRGGSDWTRLNRRLKATGRNLARNRKRSIGDILVLLDVSGSMSDAIIGQALAEIRGIFKVTGATVHVWQHDTEVVSKNTFVRKVPTLHRNAQGGTCHIQPFEEIENSGIKPEVIIGISDMFSTYPERWTGAPVVWIATEHVEKNWLPPFGQVTYIEERA